MLVAQNSLGPVCPVPLTVRGRDAAAKRAWWAACSAANVTNHMEMEEAEHRCSIAALLEQLVSGRHVLLPGDGSDSDESRAELEASVRELELKVAALEGELEGVRTELKAAHRSAHADIYGE